jgi:hypothetical protein
MSLTTIDIGGDTLTNSKHSAMRIVGAHIPTTQARIMETMTVILTTITGMINMELDNNYILIYKPTIDKYTLHSVHDESIVLDTLDSLAEALETMTRYIVSDSKGIDNAVE